MKITKHLMRWPVGLLLISLLLSGIVVVRGAQTPASNTSSIVAAPTKGAPGIAAAEAISTITGIAISPLLGVSGVGAWHYFKAPADKRSGLSWYAQPWFWLPSLALVGLCFVKDSFAPIVPTALKKPLDVAEVFENKVSAIVATGAILPILGGLYKTVSGDAAFTGSGMAVIEGGSVFSILMMPFAFAAFVVVFLAAHVINVLILISPFGTVDLALKAFRTFLLSTVTMTSFASTRAGLIWSLVIIAVCYFLAGWSFRIFIFGTVFSWDIFTGRRHRFTPDAKENWAFLAREVDKTPIRTYGKISASDKGGWMFTYKPWLCLPARQVEFSKADWMVGRGIVYPEILECHGGEHHTLFKLPPRFKTHEEELAAACRISKVDDIGLRAAFKWLRSMFVSSSEVSRSGT